MTAIGQSSLNFLEVKGIRSFHPDETSVIKFGRPLTLLHGANGSGKTTIIECLKYALTDGLPPLSQGNFIHDPKLLKRKSVDAEVKLAFNSICDDQYEILKKCRGVVHGKKVNKSNVETSTKRISGDRESESSGRKIDKTEEVIEALGVSEAVLNDVTLCHHEDSNWPLTATSAKLKEKFDNIFGLKKYEEAIKEINGIRKGKEKERLKQNYALENLKKECERAENLVKQLKETQRELISEKESQNIGGKKLDKLDEKINELDIKRSEINDIRLRKRDLNNQKTQQTSLKDDLERKLSNSNKTNVTRNITKLRKKIEKAQDEIRKNEESATEFASKSNKTHAVQGTLKHQLSEARDTRKERIEAIRDLCEKHGIRTTGRFDDDRQEMENSSDLVEKMFRETMQKNDMLKEENTKRLNQAADECQEALKKNIKLTERKKLRYKTAEILEEKQKKLQEEILNLKSIDDITMGDSEDPQSVVEALKEKLEREETICSADQSGKRLDDLRKKREIFLKRAEEIDEQIFELCEESDTRWRIDKLQDIKTIKINELQNLEKEHLGSSKEKRTLNVDDQTYQEEKLLSKINLLNELVQEKDAYIEKLKGKSQSSSRLRNVDNLQRRIIDDGKLTRKLYDDLLLKLSETFALQQDGENYNNKIEQMLMDMQSILRQDCNRIETSQQQLCKELMEIQKPEAFNEINSKLCRQVQLKENMEEVLKEMVTEKEAVENEKTMEERCSAQKGFANFPMAGDEQAIDAIKQEEICDLEKEILKLKKATSHQGVAVQLEELKDERKLTWKNVTDVLKEMDAIQQTANDRQGLINYLQKQLISQQDRMICRNRRNNLIEMEKKLIEELEVVKAEIDDEGEALILSNEKLQTLEARHREEKNITETMLREIQNTRSSILKEAEDLENLKRNIENLDEENIQTKLNAANQEIQNLKTNISKLNKDKKDLEASIEKFQKELETYLKQQDGTSQSVLKDTKKKLENVNKKLKDVEAELIKKKPETVQRSYDDMCEETLDIKRKLHESKGGSKTLKTQVESLKTELNKEDMKFANEKYRKNLVDSVVLELTSLDLLRYAKALDHAFIQMHQLRMQQINTIMKELWQQTYCGKDIESIEVCCDVKSGQRPDSPQRNFEYKVMMTCNDVKRDMRGRCSAGQKVLASLVIRLALAEVFCRKCAVLALDEPTVNLDKENMESLVDSLLKVVESRSQQSNLQLIIITHDKRLLEIIGRSRYADHYFKIQKDRRTGCSSVEKCRIQTIQDD